MLDILNKDNKYKGYTLKAKRYYIGYISKPFYMAELYKGVKPVQTLYGYTSKAECKQALRDYVDSIIQIKGKALTW